MTVTKSLIERLQSRIEAWRQKAEQFGQHACSQAAATYQVVADELERELSNWENELLSIKEAAVESGYSEETLRRKTRKGELSTERSNGKKSRIKVRRGDLPAKRIPRSDSTTASKVPYDPIEDAREIALGLGG